jgi:hypothetical protein
MRVRTHTPGSSTPTSACPARRGPKSTAAPLSRRKRTRTCRPTDSPLLRPSPRGHVPLRRPSLRLLPLLPRDFGDRRRRRRAGPGFRARLPSAEAQAEWYARGCTLSAPAMRRRTHLPPSMRNVRYGEHARGIGRARGRGCARSGRRGGRGETSPGESVGRRERSPGADVGGMAQSRCRCGRDAPSPGADVGRRERSPGAGAAETSPVPVQMWAGWAQYVLVLRRLRAR